ncbi:MAG: S8 family serine peptidase [Candidatus Cloacimonetes bacterium]|nr:S8 family serine peptidase [Candidatus Cloacimonadota bacterium]MDY0366671.1 S8 family serine peptidase [Candidatus Syntrophosphaera sp.]
MPRLKTLLTLLLVIFGTLGLAAAPSFGERPFIDIFQVPDSAMEQGHIRIKLSEANSALAQGFRYQDGALASFGLEELDALNLQYGVKKISPVFGDVSKNLKWGWRHVEWGLHLWFELEYDSAADIREIVMAYRDLAKDVQWAEPEYKKTLLSVNQDEVAAIAEDLSRWTPNDPRYGEQWHYHNTGQTGGTVDADIDLPEAWDIEKGHTDVVVCIQDQGVQYNHPDLAANMWINPGEIAGNSIDDDGNGYVDDVYGYNFYESTSTIVAGDHGCHVSGTVAGVNNNGVGISGVAGGSGTGNGVRLMSTQVFAPSSGGGGFENAPVYAADNGACISQNSWGYTSVGSYEQSVLDAIDYFNANGGGSVMSNGITIYAAGNGESSGQWYPGCYSGVFAVAGTTHEDTKAWYSNYDTWVDVSAPGGETNSVTEEGVLSCWSNSSYGFYQGTSMACPHASGVAALVVSFAHRNGRTLSSADVEDILESSADDHYAVNQSYIGQLGSGRINAYQALLATDPTLPSVSITSPAGGSVHDLNSVITITATASDTDGYITGVAFYIDDVLKSTDTSSPYSWVWNTAGYAGGAHSIKVIATDDDSNTATRSITVNLLAPPDEGFETGDFTLYPWVNNSSVPWTVQSSEVFSGTYAAESGDINDNSSTTLSLPVVVSSAGNISFWYKVSSESNYDFLRFYIDEVQQGSWSGSAGWSEASYPVTSGNHTFAWTYSKDSSVANGSDCAWLDHIIFPPMGTYYAPPRNLTAASGNGYVNLAWDAPASGTPSNYKVYRDGSYLASTGGLTYSDTNVVNNTNYEYYVTAIYGSEESDPSNAVTGFPTANPLSTIIIGEGTGSQTYPIDRYYNYSGHEAIYLASQIGSVCTIKSLGFYKASGADVNPIEAVSIYMKQTTASTLTSGAYSTDGYTLVYSGTFPNTATSGWMEVELNNLFAYDGTSNLAILTVKGFQDWISGYPFWTYTSTTGNQARQNRNDDAQPTSLTASTNLPNLKLQAYLPQGLLYPARDLTAAGGNGFVELNWTAPLSGTPSGYKIHRNGSLLTTVPGLSYTDNAVVNGTTYSYYVVATYSGEDAEPTATVQATPDLVTSVIIGDGTSSSGTSDGCPINVWYQSLHGQAVYTAAELNAKGVFGPIDILEIGFNVTGLPSLTMPNYLIRMGHTSATDASSWISTGLSTVWTAASYQPTATGWNMLTLATPFTWNGTDNIVVDTAFGLVGSYTSSGTTQYTSITNGYRFVRNDYSDQTEVFTGGTNTANRPNLQLVLEVEETEAPEIVVSPLALDFGAVEVGQASVLQFTVQNTGTAALTGTISTPAGYGVALHVAKSSNASRSAAPTGKSAPMLGSALADTRNTITLNVAAGQTLTYDLSFVPSAAQVYPGNVVISSNDADEPTVNIALSGSGYTDPSISVDPTSLAATLPVNGGENLSFTIGNSGSLDLEFILSESPQADWLSWFPPSGTLLENASQEVVASFNATGLAPGEYQTTIKVASNDPENPEVYVTVSLTVTNNAPTLTLPVEGFEFDMNDNLVVDFGPYIEDLDGHTVTLTVGESAYIQAAIDGHQVTFSAPADWFGSETLNFVVDDGYAIGYASVEVRVILSYLAIPDIAVSKSAGGVTVSWDAVTNANRYHIYRATDPYGDYEPFATVYGVTSWEDTEALPMAFYKVVAAFEDLPAKQ